MLTQIRTCTVVGLDGELIQVEVDIRCQGLCNFVVVGLPDAAVQEARERLRPAVHNSHVVFPFSLQSEPGATFSLPPAQVLDRYVKTT